LSRTSTLSLLLTLLVTLISRIRDSKRETERLLESLKLLLEASHVSLDRDSNNDLHSEDVITKEGGRGGISDNILNGDTVLEEDLSEGGNNLGLIGTLDIESEDLGGLDVGGGGGGGGDAGRDREVGEGISNSLGEDIGGDGHRDRNERDKREVTAETSHTGLFDVTIELSDLLGDDREDILVIRTRSHENSSVLKGGGATTSAHESNIVGGNSAGSGSKSTSNEHLDNEDKEAKRSDDKRMNVNYEIDNLRYMSFPGRVWWRNGEIPRT